MESPDEVRASLAGAALADLSDHEDTLAEGEARITRLPAEVGRLDRRYPERFWQLADYRFPSALFANPKDHAAPAAAPAGAAPATA